jgi:hypothetical protein
MGVLLEHGLPARAVERVTEPSSEKPYFTITATGETIMPKDVRIKQSPDGDYHWCAHQAGLDAGHTICLFVPPKGF